MTDLELELITLKNFIGVKKALHKITHEAINELRERADREAMEIKELEDKAKDLQDQIDAEVAGHPSELGGGN